MKVYKKYITQFIQCGKIIVKLLLSQPIMQKNLATGGLNGIFRNPRDSWQIVRRFTLHKLRDLGMGRPRLEEKVMRFNRFFLRQ